ncbi:MAG: hypothetical protein AAGJ83_06255 [Planctomycetota bacterium]
MGEAHRRKWIAASIFAFWLATTPADTIAQGMSLPDSLRQAANNASMGASDVTRAGTRPDGPTSNPADGPSLFNRQGPSTSPYPGNSGTLSTSDPRVNDSTGTRGSLVQNGNNGLGGTNSTMTSGTETTRPQRRAWGSTPEGINLPEKNVPSGTFGGQFGQSNAMSRNTMMERGTAMGSAAPGTPQSQTTGLDVFNSASNSTLAPSRTAQEQLGAATPPGSQPMSPTWMNGLETNGGNPTRDWTRDEVNRLAGLMGIAATDERLTNELFVNYLFQQYQERLKVQEEARANANPLSQAQIATPTSTRASLGTPGSPPTWSNTMGNRSPSDQLGQIASATDSYGRDPRGRWDLGQPLGSNAYTPGYEATRSRDRFLSNDRLADDYDRRAQRPLDDELTDLRRERDLLRRLQEDALDERRAARANFMQNNPSAGATRDYNGRVTSPPTTTQPQTGAPTFASNQPSAQIARSNEPASASNDIRQTSNRPSTSEDRIDESNLLAASEEFKHMNPYVNVFLLCSLVANVFFFVWLRRLWLHHRDLVASSRMTASGISAE